MSPNEQLHTYEPTDGEIGDRQPEARSAKPGAEVGYVVAIIINGMLLYVVRHLVEWDIVPFLTDEFDQVVPIISLSLIASVVVNGLRLAGVPNWLALLGDLISTTISLVATLRIYTVFPFDFDDGVPWDLAARGLLIIALFGTAVALIVVLVKLMRELLNRPPITGVES
jgi:hypothetical protein